MAHYKLQSSSRKRSGDKRSRRSKARYRISSDIQNASNTESTEVLGYSSQSSQPDQERFHNMSFQERIEHISSMRINELSDLIQEGGREEYIGFQLELVKLCLARILNVNDTSDSPRLPRDEQVAALRRLIFGRGDTILIARTGFGKSIIFHAYSVLTRKITLQIIPLSKLGDEQFADIKAIPFTRPCLLTSESKKENEELLSRIKNGEYTHVLLGPEQAASDLFQKALKSSSFKSKIGMVAIDELHLVQQWETFRPCYTMMRDLRIRLNTDVVWFGCTATLSPKFQEYTARQAGFNSIGYGLHHTQLIRTSINRPDITICVRPIRRKKLTSFDHLVWLLNEAVDSSFGQITPHRIPKTIIFIDSRDNVQGAQEFLHLHLERLSSALPHGNRYRSGPSGDKSCYHDVVNFFTSEVAQADKDKRFLEFTKKDSITRIMVATTALGIGVNIPDIERVVISHLPLDQSASEVWQRIGRAGREPGRTSTAFIYVPYWMFNSEGYPRKKPKPARTTPRTPSTEPKKTSQRQTSSTRSSKSIPKSSLGYSLPVEEFSDSEDLMSDAPAVEAPTSTFGKGTAKPWTESDEDHRAKILPIWIMICNGRCRRRPFLEFLGEELNIPITTPCCDQCNPAYFSSPPEPPALDRRPGKPTKSSIAGDAFSCLEDWLMVQANLLVRRLGGHGHYPMPPVAFMNLACRIEIAMLFTNKNWYESIADSIDELCDLAPLLRGWEHLEFAGKALLEELQRFPELIQGMRDERQRQKELKTIASMHQSQLMSQAQQNDALAIYIARQEVEARARNHQIELLPTLPTTDLPAQHTPPTQRTRTPTPIESPMEIPMRSSPSLLDAIRQAKALSAEVESFLQSSPRGDSEVENSSQQQIQILETQDDIIPETQYDVIPETQLDDAVETPFSSNITASYLTQDTPSKAPKRRAALAELDPNLSIMSSSRSIRKRRLTEKGQQLRMFNR